MSEQYGLGLLTPASRPLRLKSIEDSKLMLTRTEIEKRLSDPRRTPRRQIFGAEFTKNQSMMSACCGYAYALALEKARILFGLIWVKLSGDYIYSLINGGRDAGAMLDDGAKASEEQGIAPEELVKQWEYRFSKMSQAARNAAKNFRAFEAYRVDSDEGLASGLANGFIGVIATEFDQGRMASLDSDGISASSNGGGNHAENVDDVTIMRGKYVYDVHNSHSNRFGQNGRHRVTWDKHLSGPNRNHAFTLIRGVTDPIEGEWRTPQVTL